MQALGFIFIVGMIQTLRAKTQADMGGLLPGDGVESHWPQYKKPSGLVERTHHHP